MIPAAAGDDDRPASTAGHTSADLHQARSPPLARLSSERPSLSRRGSAPLIRSPPQPAMGSSLALPIAPPTPTASTSSRRLERYADPDTHWLSDGEGRCVQIALFGRDLIERHSEFMNDVDRGRSRRRDLGEGTSSRPPPPQPSDDSRDDKLPPHLSDDGSKLVVHDAPPHRISHRPASNVDSTPVATIPLPRAEIVVAALTRIFKCRACTATLVDPVTLDCGHSVCRSCLVIVPHPASSSPEPVAQPRSSPPPPRPPPPLPTDHSPDPHSSPLPPPTGGIFGRATSGAIVPLIALPRRVQCPMVSCRGQPAVPEPRGDVVLHKVLARLRLFAPRFDEPASTEIESEAEPSMPAVSTFRPAVRLPPSRDVTDDELPTAPPRPRSHRIRDTDSSDSHSSTADTPDDAAESGKRSRKVRSATTEQRRHRRQSRRQQDAAPARLFVAEVLSELECQVCVGALFDPVTTPCGHSFCAKCLARSLDHSARCPLCRTDLPGFAFFHEHPLNLVVHEIMTDPYGAVYRERKASNDRDERGLAALDTPIFICTLAFPTIVTFLRIFEPRYRLMMRRVMESESREFGMVMPGTAQGGMAEYGTMLRVVDLRLQDDGRSVVETVGTTRFRILDHGQLDGYTIGRVERVDDISLEAEAALESAALARVGLGLTPEISTDQLVAICHDFIALLRSGSAPWLVQRLNNTYGSPPTAVSDFSFWMAAVLPIDESEKAHSLAQDHQLAIASSTSCVIVERDQRLSIAVVHWISQMRESWWFGGCSIC